MPFKTLANYPLVVTDTANLARQWVEKLAQERNISLNVAHEVDMIDVQRQLVIGHRRCSLASWGLFLDELRLGNLGGRKIVEPVMSRQMRLLARPEFPEKLFDYIADKLQTSVRRMLATHRSDYWWLRLPRNKTADDQPGATASTE